MSLVIAEELNKVAVQDPFQFKRFYDLIDLISSCAFVVKLHKPTLLLSPTFRKSHLAVASHWLRGCGCKC